MDFELTKSQIEIQKAAREFARGEFEALNKRNQLLKEKHKYNNLTWIDVRPSGLESTSV